MGTQQEQFLDEHGELCYERDVAGQSLVEVTGLRDEAMELGKLKSHGAECIDSIRSRSIRADPGGTGRAGNHDGGESSGDSGGVPAPGSWTLALDSPGGGERSAGDSRMRVARKWRRKSLERLDSRPEMAPRLGHARTRRPLPQATARMLAGGRATNSISISGVEFF